MTTETYYVSLSYIDENGLVTVREIGTFGSKARAMSAAKRAARTRKDCVPYGPSSIAYVGRDATAVVSW